MLFSMPDMVRRLVEALRSKESGVVVLLSHVPDLPAGRHLQNARSAVKLHVSDLAPLREERDENFLRMMSAEHIDSAVSDIQPPFPLVRLTEERESERVYDSSAKFCHPAVPDSPRLCQLSIVVDYARTDDTGGEKQSEVQIISAKLLPSCIRGTKASRGRKRATSSLEGHVMGGQWARARFGRAWSKEVTTAPTNGHASIESFLNVRAGGSWLQVGLSTYPLLHPRCIDPWDGFFPKANQIASVSRWIAAARPPLDLRFSPTPV